MGLVIAFVLGAVGALAVGALFVRSQILAPLDTMVAQIDDVPDSAHLAERLGAVRRAWGETQEQAVDATYRLSRLNLAINALSQGVVIADASGGIIARNDQDATPRHADALLEAEVREMLALAVEGETLERELRVFGPPAKVLFLAAMPLWDDGVITGAVVQIDDVTEPERLDAMRRDLVANLSHELRTPVGAISLLAETIVDETDLETRERLASRLVAESTRLALTIDELLELSRIEHDDQHERDEVVLQSILEEAVARSKVLAEKAQVSVGVVVPDDDLVMWGNRWQLVAAVANLVDNAVKYSAEGDSVSVRARALPDGLVQVTVQDTGRGIPIADQKRVFERFYRVDRSRRSDTGGTGLGLSIVRHVVLNHQGTIDLTSAEGDGSTFTMTFPSGIGLADSHDTGDRGNDDTRDGDTRDGNTRDGDGNNRGSSDGERNDERSVRRADGSRAPAGD